MHRCVEPKGPPVSDICLLDQVGVMPPPGETNRTRTVVAALRDDIASGVFEPGERLTEDRLSGQYRVSRVPVREALKVLEAQGFVHIEPNRGATVSVLSLADAADLYVVREVVESLAARRAARRAASEHVEFLRDIVRRGKQADKDGISAALPALNSAFHLGVLRAADSAVLQAQLEQLMAKLQWLYRERPMPSDLLQRGPISWAEHEAILQAIAEGRSADAERGMREHLEAMRRAMIFRRVDAATSRPAVVAS